MNRVQRTVRALAAPASLLLACAGAWASEHDEHKLVQNQPDVIAESPAGLPFAVAGAMTAPPTRFGGPKSPPMASRAIFIEGPICDFRLANARREP